MRTTAPDLGHHDEAGAAGSMAVSGIMSVLAWLPRLVAIHLAWVLLVLLGGVVVGLAPATTTLITVLRRDGEFARTAGPRGLAAAVWQRYRRELVGANQAAGPFVIIALAAAANVGLGLAGALPTWYFPVGFTTAILLLVVATLAGLHAIALHTLRPAAPAPVIWRGALAGLCLLPVATASIAVTLTATVVIVAIIQPVGMLCGGGILVAVTTYLLVRPWQSRLDAVLVAPRSSDGRSVANTTRGIDR